MGSRSALAAARMKLVSTALLLGATCACGNIQRTDTEPDAGSGAAGGAPSSECGCSGEFWVDAVIGADQLRLTAPAPDVRWGASGPTDGGYDQVACVPPSTPWASTLRGALGRIADVKACSGPGAAPPCLWLAEYYGQTVEGADGVYRDSTGIDRRVLVQLFAPEGVDLFMLRVPTPLEGTFTGTLDDGREVSGSFKVCMLRQWMVA